MKFLVVSRRHELLPFANRLLNEGHEVDVVVWKKRYEASWAGRFNLVRDKPDQDFYDRYRQSGYVLLTNTWVASERFGEGFGIFVTPELKNEFRLGGWITAGGTHEGQHMAVVDRGAWIGNQGPNLDAATFLIRVLPEVSNDLLDTSFEQARHITHDLGFTGLWQADFALTVDGPVLTGIEMGWPMLQAHAFFSEQNMGDVLTGQAEAHLPKRITGAVALTVPPWPNQQGGASQGSELTGLTMQQLGRVWWHDVVVDQANQSLSVAGLDGLVGVATGSADTALLARSQALSIPSVVGLPEKQYRSDAGSRLDVVLGQFEEQFGVSFI